ncbi:MAG: alpha/beta fold hydrolase [Planctomycetota bacterium]
MMRRAAHWKGRTSPLFSRNWLAALMAVVLLIGGCATSNKWVSVRSTPNNPLTDTLGLLGAQGPKPTERTEQLLRRYDLGAKSSKATPQAVLDRLTEIDVEEPNREHLYALAELAYIDGTRAERGGKAVESLEFYGSATVHAYRYLFDDAYPMQSNPYDPHYRRACDIYNASVEGVLRLMQKQGPIRPGTTQQVETANHDCRLEVKLISEGWHEEDFDRFEFVSNYQVHGLQNHYRRFGLGVPLIALRRCHEDSDPREEFYPDDLSFAVTAFLRPESIGSTEPANGESGGKERVKLTLELHDTLEHSDIEIAGTRVPLESDLSTPLAYFLSQPALDDTRISTAGLLKPEKVEELRGLYMLEPFRKDRIPVVMVHGLWSSPATWMEMFNDLRSDPFIREYYQFWFYLYPTGQPFWFSAAGMRQDMAHMRQRLDPDQQSPALDQMVLVGHSMGGLVSKLQTVDSNDRFWKTLSDEPFAKLDADPEVRAGLERTFFFDPSPSVRRVVTIGTPHRGSDFSNDFTRWLGRSLIRVPTMISQGRNQLVARNPDYFRPDAPLDVTTSIDSLSPESPLLSTLIDARTGPWVRFHNIAGLEPASGVKSLVAGGDGDGVVPIESARLEDAVSEVIVPASHSAVHRHPQSILEVRRILMEHLQSLRTYAVLPLEESGEEEPAMTATLPEESAAR